MPKWPPMNCIKARGAWWNNQCIALVAHCAKGTDVSPLIGTLYYLFRPLTRSVGDTISIALFLAGF